MGLTSRKNRLRNQSYYKSNKDAVIEKHKHTTGQLKETKSKWYMQNSCKVLWKYQKKYALCAELKKRVERERYASQPELKRMHKREKCASQPELKRMHEREKSA